MKILDLINFYTLVPALKAWFVLLAARAQATLPSTAATKGWSYMVENHGP